MKIILTDDFKKNTLLADKGVKCVLRGFALVKDSSGWLKKQFDTSDAAIRSVSLTELQEQCSFVLDEDKNDSDILNNLFDITYEPCLELQVPDDIDCPTCNGTGLVDGKKCTKCDGKGWIYNTDTKGTVLGGEKFGTYKIRMNSMRNNLTEKGLKGTYRAIVLIGEKYTEDTVHVTSLNKSYLGIIIYFGNTDSTATINGITEDADGLHIEKDSAFTINFQFSLSTYDVTAGSTSIELDEEYDKIVENSFQKDQTTTQLSIPGAFLVPSGKDYSRRVEQEAGPSTANLGIGYLDKTLNLIPDTYKNNNIFNVTPRVNIFDEHNDKFVKPQMMLSYGDDANGAQNSFTPQSIAVEYDKKFFAMNEKAPTAASRFDLFGGATKAENVNYDDNKFIKTSGYLRLVSDRGEHIGGSDMTEILSNANTAGINNGALYISDNNYLGNSASDTNQTSDFHMIDSEEITATSISGGAVIDSTQSYFDGYEGLTAVGTYKASALSGDKDDLVLVNPSRLMMYGLNTSSVSYNGRNNVFIGHKGLNANNSHDAIVFGKYNGCGNKEYDICLTCQGEGRVLCQTCKGAGQVTGYPQVTCTECMGFGFVNYSAGLCTYCNGTGIYDGKACPICYGKTYSAQIPALSAGTYSSFVSADEAIYNCPICDSVGTVQGSESGYIECTICDGTGREKCSACSGEGYIEGYEHPLAHSACPTCKDFLMKCPVCSGNEKATDCPRCGGDRQVCDECSGFGIEKCNLCSGTTVQDCPECNNQEIVTCDLCEGEGVLTDLQKAHEYVGNYGWKSYREWALGYDEITSTDPCLHCNGTGIEPKYAIQYGLSSSVYWYICFSMLSPDDDLFLYPTGKKVVSADAHGNPAGMAFETKILHNTSAGAQSPVVSFGGNVPRFAFETSAAALAWASANSELCNNVSPIFPCLIVSANNLDIDCFLAPTESTDSRYVAYTSINKETLSGSHVSYASILSVNRPIIKVYDTETECKNAIEEYKAELLADNITDVVGLTPIKIQYESICGKCLTCAGSKQKVKNVTIKCPKCTNIKDWKETESKLATFNYSPTIYSTDSTVYYRPLWFPENLVLFRNYYCGKTGKTFATWLKQGYHECELCNGLGYVSKEQRVSFLGENFESRFEDRFCTSSGVGYYNAKHTVLGMGGDWARMQIAFGDDTRNSMLGSYLPTSGTSSLCPKCSNFFYLCQQLDYDLTWVSSYCYYDHNVYNYSAYSAKSVHDYIWNKFETDETKSGISAMLNDMGVDQFCDTCNFNNGAKYIPDKGDEYRTSSYKCNNCGFAETGYVDKLGQYQSIFAKNKFHCPCCDETDITKTEETEEHIHTIDGRGLVECTNCRAGWEQCLKCNGVKHWFCTTCSGDGEVKFQPTIAYEDGKVVAVGDGYFYRNMMEDPENFDLYRDYINITPSNNCDLGIGQYIKKMNLFSVEHNGLLTVHNNNYDPIPDSHVTHKLAEDFFAVRAWAKDPEITDKFAYLQNACYSPKGIFFPKKTAHNEEWKLRLRELNYLLNDSYIKSNSLNLITDKLEDAMSDFYRKNNTFVLKLGPKITYKWVKGIKGVKSTKGYKMAYKGSGAGESASFTTSGLKGMKGMKGIKAQKGVLTKQSFIKTTYLYKSVYVKGLDYNFYLQDILDTVKQEYGRYISNKGNLGKNPETYTFYCINGDPSHEIYFKGLRLRKMANGNYQTLHCIKGIKAGKGQRIVYKDNGYNGEYGVMNFNYAYSNTFLN